MDKMKDVGMTRNSDLVEAGIDEFAHYGDKKKAEPKTTKKTTKAKK